MAQVSTGTFLGRTTAGTGNVEAMTVTQATALLNVFTSTLNGLAPLSGGGTTNYLRADGTWNAPPGSASGAPSSASYVVIANDATLTAERVLTGTANQITITDGGANNPVTLSTPQNIATASIVQFGRMGLGLANSGAAYLEVKTLTSGSIQGFRAEGDTIANVQFSSFITGDAQLRFSFLADGTQKWGSGAAVADTNLYRSAVNTLKTDNTLLIGTPGTVSLSAATIDGTQTLTNKTATSSTNNITAKSLFSATTTVDVSAATAPTVGQVLTATSSTTATWQTAGAGSGTSLGLVQATAIGLLLT